MDDPSQGRTIYKYDTSGNVYEETHADGKIIQSGYDSYNRLKSVQLRNLLQLILIMKRMS